MFIPPLMTTSTIIASSDITSGFSSVSPTDTFTLTGATTITVPSTNSPGTMTVEFPLVTTTITRMNGHTSIPVLTATYAYAQSTDVTLATSHTTLTLFNSTHSSSTFSENDAVVTLTATETVDDYTSIVRSAQSNNSSLDGCWMRLFRDLTTMVYEFPGPWGKLVVAVPDNSRAAMHSIHLTSLEERGISAEG